jgi:hypothetical protein
MDPEDDVGLAGQVRLKRVDPLNRRERAQQRIAMRLTTGGSVPLDCLLLASRGVVDTVL